MRGNLAIVLTAGFWGCSLAFPLDFSEGLDGGTGGTGGSVGGGSAGGSVAGGSAGGAVGGGRAGGSVGGGSAGGSIGGGSAGGSVAGGSAGGSVAGGSAGGVPLSLLDAGCQVVPSSTVIECFLFDTPSLPAALQRVRTTQPSSDITAEVIFDGGRPGGVLRMTVPTSPGQNGVDHGAYFGRSVGVARRLYVAFDIFPVQQMPGAQLHFAEFLNPGFGSMSFSGDPGGLQLYLSGLAMPLDSTNVGPPVGEWRRMEWFVDFDGKTTRVNHVTPSVLTANVDAGVSGDLDFRFGVSRLYAFDQPLVVLFDNVVVRALP